MFKSKSENINKVHLNNDPSSRDNVIMPIPAETQEEEEQCNGLRKLLDNDNDGSIPQSPLLD